MPSDHELLDQARHRPEALGEFYDRYEAAVAAYFMRATRHAPTAHEPTAETFAEVVLQMHRGARVEECASASAAGWPCCAAD